MRFSLSSGFLYINEHVCKQICPVWLQGREDWIHPPSKPIAGVEGGVGLHPFCFVVRFFLPFLPPFFSHLGLALSPSRLRTRMSRNSSLDHESPGLC